MRVVGCRYHGPGQRQPYGSLAQSRVLSAQALAIEINEGQVIPAGAYSSCAADPDDSYLMVFQYRDGSRLLVRIGVDGCIDATNGDRDVFQSNDLLLTLGTKFGHDKINTRSCGGDVSACMQQQDQTP